MNVEQFREECLALPYTTEDMPFDDTVVVFRLKGKIFACIPTDRPNIVVVKCDPDYAVELKEQYASIEGAHHWNKKYWIQIDLYDRSISNDLMSSLIRQSYHEVNKKLPKNERVDGIERQGTGFQPEQ